MYELHFGFGHSTDTTTSSRHFLNGPASLYLLSWIESLHFFFRLLYCFLSFYGTLLGGVDC